MMIILEGPRGVGKTRMANDLFESFKFIGVDVEIAKFERGEAPFADMYRQMDTMLDAEGKLFIVDRFHLTEFVMGTYHRRYPSLLQLSKETVEIDTALSKMGVPMFILKASREAIAKRIASRNDGRGEEMPWLDSANLWYMAERFSEAKCLWVESEHDYKRAFKIIRGDSINQLEIV